MDLAKIRKKAKELQQDDGLNPVENERKSARKSASVQAAPVNVEMPEVANQEPNVLVDPGETDVFVESKIVNVVEQDSLLEETIATKTVDPLDELFRQTPDSQLASEENYLRDLTDERDADEDLRQWLTFSLAEEEYAIDIDTIDEICKPREVTEIPNAPAFVLGIISLRGKIVPVFDLRCRLQLGNVVMTPATRIVVCQASETQVGLLVDSITQVVKLANADIEPPPMVLSGLDRDMIEGVGRSNNRMLILLNLSNVITIDKD
jgi:purine-binding chemotaxis protein CheW